MTDAAEMGRGLSHRGCQTKTKLPHFRELDGLRGVASLVVLFHHFFLFSVGPVTGDTSLFMAVVSYALSFGYLGVDIFFVLSGFLITSLLLLDRGKTEYFRTFYWKRVLRILPVYLVHLLIAAIFVPHSLGYIILSLLFIQNFSRVFHVYQEAGPTWTLSIEEQFYLIWPQFVRRCTLRTLYHIAFFLIIFSNVSRLVPPLLHHPFNLRYTFFRCDGLAFGTIIALRWFSDEAQTPMIRRVLAALDSNLTLVAAFLLACLSWPHAIDSPFGVQGILTSVNYLVYRLIGYMVRRAGAGKTAIPGLGSPVAVYFGSISYALYMYHVSIMQGLIHVWGYVPVDRVGQVTLRALAAFVLSVAASTASRYALELPAQKLRRLVLRPRVPISRADDQPIANRA